MNRLLAVIGLMIWALVTGLHGDWNPISTAAIQAKTEIAQLEHHKQVSPPGGWRKFCKTPEGKSACDVAPENPVIVLLTEDIWRQLVRINADVNRTVKPLSDQDHWGENELWSYPTDGQGDCEDYVLEKRRRLMDAGWPRSALLITVVLDHDGEGHAVLMVRTDRGDLVLDNQVGKILRWNETGYRFIKRQSAEHPEVWVSLGHIKAPARVGQQYLDH